VTGGLGYGMVGTILLCVSWYLGFWTLSTINTRYFWWYRHNILWWIDLVPRITFKWILHKRVCIILSWQQYQCYCFIYTRLFTEYLISIFYPNNTARYINRSAARTYIYNSNMHINTGIHKPHQPHVCV